MENLKDKKETTEHLHPSIIHVSGNVDNSTIKLLNKIVNEANFVTNKVFEIRLTGQIDAGAKITVEVVSGEKYLTNITTVNQSDVLKRRYLNALGLEHNPKNLTKLRFTDFKILQQVN
jgi:hypothetical protein